MDFGRVPEATLNQIDFTLPAEPAGNESILAAEKKEATKPLVYVGCPRWGAKEWVGKIYPKGTKETYFLNEYVKHFNAIELNATHYKIYTPAEIQKWADKAKDRDFKFCPKLPQSISHHSSFANVDAVTTSFLQGVLAFGEQLGPIFLQLSEQYTPQARQNLYRYLRSLPADLSFFLEVRHPDWFASGQISAELFGLLKELNIGAIITDTAGRRDGTHMHLTVPKAFVRFVGNSLHPTDYTRINDWVNRLQYWLSAGLQELYFFMHMPDETNCPELVMYLVDKLNAACGLRLPRPYLAQPTLF